MTTKYLHIVDSVGAKNGIKTRDRPKYVYELIYLRALKFAIPNKQKTSDPMYG